MDKNESTILKGVAILFMLFLHLFNQMSNVELCHNFLYIGETPLVHILSRATNPVDFFIILSGYGLYTVRIRGNYNVIKKLWNLYKHYWITLLIFVPLGAYIVGTHKYPGSPINIINNITAWNTSYNGEIWFMFPYCLLALSSKTIFWIMSKLSPIIYFAITLLIYFCCGYCISRYGASYLYTHKLAYMPILYLELLFSFSMGAYMANYDIVRKFDRIKDWRIGGVLLIIIVLARCLIESGAFHPIYAAVFIILFVNTTRPVFIDNTLMEFGKRSTSMWFIHTYFCYYLFHDEIYAFKYPIIIYFVLISISYAMAVVIDYLVKVVNK